MGRLQKYIMKIIKHYDFKNMKQLPTDFNVEVGDKWANKELQHYVDSKNNLFFDNGLVIRSTYEDGIIKSSRINTKNNFYFKYGKIEMIAKVPDGLGTWPAFWMMPQFNKYGHWPKSGEIDIMEHNGHNKDKFYACLHCEKYNHRDGDPYDYREIIEGISSEFTKYGLEWTENDITYYVNDREIVRYKKGGDRVDTPDGWPFDEEFYIILNLAMGGMFGGEVDYNSFPQDYIIQDIKVYQ